METALGWKLHWGLTRLCPLYFWQV